jgi:hypothetical protein
LFRTALIATAADHPAVQIGGDDDLGGLISEYERAA